MSNPITPRPGTRLRSTACTTEVVVVRASGGAVDLRCGGLPMVDLEAADAARDDASGEIGTLVGKRYWSEEAALELLCTKAGSGQLSVGDVPMVVRSTAALPSSD